MKMCATVAGFAGGAALMHLGAISLGQVVIGLAGLGLVLPVTYFLAQLPIFLTLHLDQKHHNEICCNTLHHTAVAWCAVDPKMREVFSHFKHAFDQANPKTRARLISLMLGWDQPQSLLDLRISHTEAKRRFDVLFPNEIEVEVEDKTSAWRTFTQKYLRI